MHKYALVVIDMQRGFLDPSSPLYIAGAADTVPACARAIDCCHRAGGVRRAALSGGRVRCGAGPI